MIFRKFSICIFLFLLFVSHVHAEDTWAYKILEEETAAVDFGNSNINIDYAKREITLPKYPLPNISDFMPGGAYNFAILKEDGPSQYVFDGQKMIEIATLKTTIDNPLAIAMSPLPYTMTVSKIGENGTNDILNYTFNQGTMVYNPVLSISGIQQVYSMATFKSTGELAILHETELNFYTYAADKLIPIPNMQLKDIIDPIAVATASDYNFAILDKKRLTWYSYDGSSMCQIPAMSLSFDETMKNPKALTINDNMAFILNENQVKAYKYDENSLREHAAFSVTRGLTKPYSISLRGDSTDLIIVDGIEGSKEDFRLRYFMFDGTKMVENEALSLALKLVAAGIWYKEEGTFITSAKIPSATFADYIKVKAYCEVPKDTEITFYVANEGETIENVIWYESWRIRNPEGTEIIEKAHRKNDGSIEWKDYGTIDKTYPNYEDILEINNIAHNDENLIIEEDENGNIIIKPKDEEKEPNLWTRIPINWEKIDSEIYKNIRIKAVMKTSNKEVTPKIFAPIGTNNSKGINDLNEIAIKWEINASPYPIEIDPIDPTEPNYDDDDYEKVPGWIYTTTPEFKWTFKDADKEAGSSQKQAHYEILVVKKDKEGLWKLAYDSLKVQGEDNSYRLPTSYEPSIRGPLWAADSYQFAVTIRVWDNKGGSSHFYKARKFNILAFERPRISNIVNPPADEKRSLKSPTKEDITSHFMILPNMKKEDLINVKAGAEVTLLIDSVGPIETLPEEISKIYMYDQFNQEILVDMGECVALNPLGLNDVRNSWALKFWTKAPIEVIPDNTLIMMKLIGKGEIGGTTVFYTPPYADGIVVTKETIYDDWQVTLEESEK